MITRIGTAASPECEMLKRTGVDFVSGQEVFVSAQYVAN